MQGCICCRNLEPFHGGRLSAAVLAADSGAASLRKTSWWLLVWAVHHRITDIEIAFNLYTINPFGITYRWETIEPVGNDTLMGLYFWLMITM
jgi:hypothetical protein